MDHGLALERLAPNLVVIRLHQVLRARVVRPEVEVEATGAGRAVEGGVGLASGRRVGARETLRLLKQRTTLRRLRLLPPPPALSTGGRRSSNLKSRILMTSLYYFFILYHVYYHNILQTFSKLQNLVAQNRSSAGHHCHK